jgi:hypothetical protein
MTIIRAVRPALAIEVSLACIGCTTSPPATPEIEAALAQIADQCGLQRSALTLAAEYELHVQPSPDDTYESVSCALGKIDADRRLRNLNMGFVGNEAPEEIEPNAQTH